MMKLTELRQHGINPVAKWRGRSVIDVSFHTFATEAEEIDITDAIREHFGQNYIDAVAIELEQEFFGETA